jgi:hypothetical protein
MRKISLGQDVNKPLDEVWATIGDFGGIRKWAPAVKDETTEQSAEGLWRTLTMPDGRVVRELQVDSGPSHYTYTMERDDMKVYRSTVAARPGTDAPTMIELTIEFDVAEGGDVRQATEGFLAFLGGNIRAMQKALGVA